MRLIDVMHLGRPPGDRSLGGRRRGDRPGADVVPRDAARGARRRAPAGAAADAHPSGPCRRERLARAALARPRVYVHERGARHMADPERLIKSARMLYGEDMDRRWGELVPVPEENLRVLHGGETLFGGAFEVAYTPGHASHHVSYLHDGTAFVGDTGGVRIASSSLTIPPSPPPTSTSSRGTRRSNGSPPGSRSGSSRPTSARARTPRRSSPSCRRGSTMGGAGARSGARGVHRRRARAEIEEHADPALLEAYEQAVPPDQAYAGRDRYWGKRARTPAPRAAPAGVTRQPELDGADGRAAARRRTGQRPRRAVAGGRAQRRPQYLRPRRGDAPAGAYRASPSRTATGWPTGSTTPAARSSGAAPATTPRATGRAERRRPDDGPA